MDRRVVKENRSDGEREKSERRDGNLSRSEDREEGRRDIMRKILELLKPSKSSFKPLKKEISENYPLRTKPPSRIMIVIEEIKFNPGMDLGEAGIIRILLHVLHVLQTYLAVIPVEDLTSCPNVETSRG